MPLIVGELAYKLGLDDDPFTKGLSQSEGKAANTGRAMTTKLTLPLLAAGGAAVKLGTDFDTSFARMVGLAGVPKAEIDGLKDSVLDLAGKTAQAPQELADALYDAASAGLDSAQAMDAVTVAARGAAAGMGTTGDIVGLIASATASYGAANIDAAKATDILTATIRAGRADPAELAGTLGRILPVAAQLGVSFDEVGGATAFLSNVFGDTNRTVTALSGFLIKLVSPSEQGRKALEDMGTSAEELQGAIDDKGLMGALDLLREKGFAGNQQALRALFDDIEGFQGALALLNDESGTLNETLAETKDSTGALGEAQAAAATDGQTMKQALVDLQVAAIKAGDVIGPFVATVASGISTVAGAFADLPGPAQGVVLAMAGIMASVGPVLSVAGKISRNWQALSSGFETVAVKSMYMGDRFAAVKGKAVGLAAELGVLYAATQLLGGEASHADLSKLENAILDVAQAGKIGGEAADLFGDDLGKLAHAIEDVAAPSNAARISNIGSSLGRAFGNTDDQLSQSRAKIDDLDKALTSLAQQDPDAASEALRRIVDGLPPAAGERLVGLLHGYQGALAEADTAQRLAGDSASAAAPKVDELGGAVDGQTEAIDATVEALQGYSDHLRAMFDPLFGVQDAAWKLKDAQDAVTAAVAANSDANADNNVTQDELIRLQQAAVRAAADYEGSLAALKAGIEDGSVSLDTSIATLQRWVDQGLITQEQADQAAWAFTVLKGEADKIPEQVGIKVDADVTGAQRAIAIMLGQIPATVGIRVDASYAGPSYRRASGGPVWSGQDFLVGEEGPEIVRFGGAGHVFDANTTRQMMSGGGSTAPAQSAAPTVIDQSQHTFAPRITTGLDPAETFAALDRYTRLRYGRSLASVVGS